MAKVESPPVWPEQELLSRNNRGRDIRDAEVAHAQNRHAVWGVAAEYDDTELLVAAALTAKQSGLTRMDAYTPMPIEGLSEAIGFRNKQMPALMFLGGLLGGTGAMFMEYFANMYSYPLSLGGRPYFAWPNFIVICFEGTILFSALTGVFGMLALNGLPTLYHPIFNTPDFDRASQDRFFLAIEARDKNFDLEKVMALLKASGALNVSVVEK